MKSRSTVFFDAFDGLAAVLREQPVDHGAHAQDFLGMQIDIGGLVPPRPESQGLMNKDAGIGQRKTLSWECHRRAGQQRWKQLVRRQVVHNVGFSRIAWCRRWRILRLMETAPEN